MRAGKLRHWLIIEQNTISVDANGDRTESWATFAQCWGQIMSGVGREFFAAKQVYADLSHSILIRYVAGVKHDMRIKFVDPKNSNTVRYFNIRSVANRDERNESLQIQASEVSL
jgi:SPP1 family predicted phage head-tail adaptor